MESSMQAKEQILKDVYGYTSFRQGQAEIIDTIIEGRDVLAIMPTSAGKSLCYQIPALMLPGITLVISPLISLMKDQVDSLRGNGIQASFLNSTLAEDEVRAIYQSLRAGATRILYVAPERLTNADFLDFIASFPVSFISVDEAHCISSWGHDFRPAYRSILGFIEALSARIGYRPRIAAFTGTATKEVQKDIVQQLNMSANHGEVVLSFDRPNLYFAVEEPRSGAEKLARIKELLGPNPEPTIIYCRTRRAVESVAAKLQKAGYNADFYHAGLEPDERSRIQDAFQYGEVDVMVATNAFGMGIDKPDVRQVIHYGISDSLEAYYQEAGRAGRDGQKSRCTLFYSGADVVDAKRRISMENDPLAASKLDAMLRYTQTAGCLRRCILEYFGEETREDCGDCSNCLDEGERIDISLESRKILACVYRIKERFGYSVGVGKVAAVLKGSTAADILSKHFDEVSTYGIMSEESEATIRQYIQVLVASGYLQVSGEYAVLELTPRGYEQFSVRAPIKIRKRPERGAAAASRGEHRERPERSIGARAKSGAEELTSDYPESLYDALRAKRLEAAREVGRPAFMIFSDKTLQDMAARQPLTEAEFSEVYGVGAQKTKQYAAAFTAVVAEWKHENE
ncbi:ATP-dependent DNA helicase RecQ [Alloscardovia macacae]|uniref:DNA helicase RecQ n=2 Tax=Alloscardovia macacae TaxID=1160091 RepID=A0A261F5J9_9BIFI|nr:ATP-dependent DNA helicase RecQ [Alloscardovia macacae]